MPVGAGSIKRAARKAAAIETQTETVEAVKTAEAVAAAPQKAAPKKTAEPKKAPAKKAAEPKKAPAKKAEAPETIEEEAYDNDAVHVTEEMPVWLL